MGVKLYKGVDDANGNPSIVRKVAATEFTLTIGESTKGGDLKIWGAGANDYYQFDNSVSKIFHYRYTAEADPGRTHYIYARGSAMGSGKNLQAMQINSRATGTGSIAGGTDGAEIKAGMASDSDTGTLASARAIIANVDAKKGTITAAQVLRSVTDVGAGGTITSLEGVTAYLNNSGTVTAGIAFLADAVEGYGWTNAFVCNVSAKGTDGWLLKAGTSASPLASTVAGMGVAVYNTQSATTGTNRLAVFDLKLTGSITTLSATALRAHTQLSANSITGGAYIYGGQHKFTLGGGTINHADSRVCAGMVQLDLSTGTYTAGQLSALWIDCGAASAMVNNGGQFNIVRITNTTAVVPNAVMYIYAEGSYLLELGGPGGNADWFAATASGGATRKYAIKVKCPDGVDGYLSVYTD